MIVGCYVRVSTTEQAREGYSITEQSRRLTKYCEAHDWQIYKIYSDPGYSGSNMNRPALKQMLNDVEEGKLNKILVYKLDRLSRSQKDTLYLIEDKFLANDVDFSSMHENFDTSTPFGRAMIGILAVFAQLEREQIKERMSMGREARAKEGYFTGNQHPPYGYDYQNHELIINDYEAIAVRRIYELGKQGIGPWTIARLLEEEGFKPRNKYWVHQSVTNILTSRIYIGEVSFAKKWYKGRHDPIISYDDFELVRQKFAERSASENSHSRNPVKATSYLSGIIFCKRCGNKFYKMSCSTKCKEGYKYNYYYACFGRTHPKHVHMEKPCDNIYHKVDDLDSKIFDEVKKLYLDPEYFKEIVAEAPVEKDNSKAIREEMKRIDAQISKLMDLYAVGSMPMNIVQEKIDNLDANKSALQSQLEKEGNKKDRKKILKIIEKTISTIPQIIEEGSFEDKRNLMGTLIDRIIIDGEDIEIHWNF